MPTRAPTMSVANTGKMVVLYVCFDHFCSFWFGLRNLKGMHLVINESHMYATALHWAANKEYMQGAKKI